MKRLIYIVLAFFYLAFAHNESYKELSTEDISLLVNIVVSSSPEILNFQSDYKTKLSLKLTPAEVAEVKRRIQIYNKFLKKKIKKYLENGKIYIPLIKQIFDQYNLPDDLIFLPIIESYFNIKAKSPAGAVGLWQFMPQTGRMYGLEINKWIDERFDVEKSTIAAALYLKDLYLIFDDWFLALASYNIGEGNIIRRINKYGGTNFWDINSYLPRETRNYVPNFIATVSVVKNILKEEDFDYSTLNFDIVKINKPVSLELVSVLLKLPYENLIKLNPHLLKEKTPPKEGIYNVYVPRGYGKTLAFILEEMQTERYKAIGEYKVQKGDTLIKIAKKFNTTVSYLKKINNLDKGWIIANTYIKVPTYIEAYPLYSDEIIDLTEDILYTEKGIIYRVKKGDTLAKIARKFGVSIKNLKRWNKIKNYILPNQKLVIYKKVFNKNLSQKFIKRNISYLKKKVKKRKPKYKYIFYKVKKGDTLIKIAKKFGVSVKQLKKWNKLSSNVIHIGDKITIIKRIIN